MIQARLALEMNRPAGIFYGWIVVATAAFGLLLGAFPITVFSFGVFFQAFLRDFHASRGAISLAFTLHNFISGACAVFIGRIADRFGARKVILPGLAILGLLLIAAEAIGSQIWQLYVFYAVLGIAAPATTTVPYALVVSRWFDQRRGLAIGFMMAGLGTGAIVMPMLAQRLIAGYGWRTAFAMIGAGILLIPIPVVALLLRDTPAEMGLLPDGGTQAAARAPRDGCVEGLTWDESWRSPTFWLMVAAFVLLAASVHACVIHMPELFADRGATASAAAMASSVIGVALLIGRVGSGYFLDRHFGPYVALAISGLSAMGIALLWIGTTGALALVAAFLVGLAMGAEVDIIAFLMSRYFGLRSLGRTFGFAFAAFVLAGGVGPLVMGFVFDRTGSYRPPLAGFFAATLVAAALIARLGPYRFGVRLGGDARVAVRADARPEAS